MKVLVTGGCGFLGSHVCEFFRAKDWEVISLDNMTKHELSRTGYQVEVARDYNWRFLERMGVELITGDIRSLEQVCDSASSCHYIVHTAAQPAMTISCEEPLLDFSTNVLGTLNVLEAARKHRIPIVSCSTIHVYGNWINDTLVESQTRYLREPQAIGEDDAIMRGHLTPLHASKVSTEFYIRTYSDTYRVNAGCYRLTGLYGPRQFGGEDHGWVANFCIRNVLDRPIMVYGNGKQVRDILYARDAAAAFWAFFRCQLPGIYNVGGGPAHAISLLESIHLIEAQTGIKSRVEFGPSRFGDLKYFVCDTSRVQRALGWQPEVKPQEGIAKLIMWVKENRNLFMPPATERCR